LIGTLRREFFDHVLFWNVNDLERELDRFRQHYNAHRVHTALNSDKPSESAGEAIGRCADFNQYHWKSFCRGLYQLPVAT